MPGTQCKQTQSHPSHTLKSSAIIPGIVETQILSNIYCQILHLCISYNKETVFFTVSKSRIKVPAIFYYGMTHFRALSLQAGIEFRKNLRVRSRKYGGSKLEYFWVVKSKKSKIIHPRLNLSNLFTFFVTKQQKSFFARK